MSRILLLFFCFLFLEGNAQIKKVDTYYYNPKEQLYLPANATDKDYKSISFILDSNQIMQYRIQINAREEFSLYIQNKLFGIYTPNQGVVLLDMANNKNQLRKGKIFATVFTEEELKNNVFIKKKEVKNGGLEVIKPSEFQSIHKNFKNYQNKYLFGLVLIIFSMVLLKTIYPNIYNSSIDLIFQLKSNQKTKSGVYQFENLIIGLFAFILLSVLYFTFFTDILHHEAKNESIYRLSVLFLFIILLLLLRIVFHAFFNPLFKARHFSKFMIVNYTYYLFFLIILATPVYFLFFSPYMLQILSPGFFSINLILILFWLLLMKELYDFYKFFNLRKIFLIAYICICDIIPFIILFKLLKEISFS